MDEALRILQEEGFTLPDDVKETLSSFTHNTRRHEEERYITGNISTSKKNSPLEASS